MSVETEDRERAEFEIWARGKMLCDPTGDMRTQAAYFSWMGWQAAQLTQAKKEEIARRVAALNFEQALSTQTVLAIINEVLGK